MSTSQNLTALTGTPEFLSGGGELGQRIREYDWSKTPLGPVETWPQSLRTCIRIMLTSRQPIWIGWGKELIKFYNDPYKAIVGGKHPWALGAPASKVWKEIWDDIVPLLRQVMDEDQGTYVESQLLIMERNGYPEETYYTFSYTPISGDDGKTEGMFCANTDDTDKIISDRQFRTLTRLGKQLTDCRSIEDVFQRSIATIEENPYDFPFAFFRVIKEGEAILGHSTLNISGTNVPKVIDLKGDGIIASTINKAFITGQPQLVNNISNIFGKMPTGAWPISSDKMLAMPILHSVTKEPYCMLIIGLNPYRLLDEKYSGFFSLIADQVATSLADVNVLEEERKRSEALAEIDRAKTTFFSNISHEFRTPLTLLLGPVEDTLNDPQTKPHNRARMEVAYSNALRMQKLVNTLLEFSRIEAGRSEGKFARVNICTLTEDLASTFRSAIEKAGMKLQFECGNIKDEVYLDIDMWEKIVLNLVSNAFKYSKDGVITVAVQQVDHTVQLTVSDTGVGIPEEHLEKVFDRFHRIENTQGRSQEGTGIGLAMVKELVRLHHGSISVKSKINKGSTFTVTIRVGKDHLSEQKIITDSSQIRHSSNIDAFVVEAMKWLPETEHGSHEGDITNYRESENTEGKPVVVLADDNADMRNYVKRLLSDSFHVVTATNGEEAFEKILHHRPELLLSDIMMPKLDGFGLLQKIRGHFDIKNTPVIFLSARAGEEAKVEGLDAGADDYLVKPFSARELLAKVEANIKINRSRQTAQRNLETLFQRAPVSITILKGDPLRFELANEEALSIWGKKREDVIGKPWYEVFPELVGQGYAEQLQQIIKSGLRFIAEERPLEIVINEKKMLRYFSYAIEPLQGEDGKSNGVMTVGIDVTYSVIARKKIEESEQYFRKLADSVPAMLWLTDPYGMCTYLNKSWYDTTGQTQDEAMGYGWLDATHPDDAEMAGKIFQRANENQEPFHIHYRLRQKNGEYRWSLDSGRPRFDADGNFEGFIGSVIDIHDQKLAEEKMMVSEAQFRELANAVPQLVWMANGDGAVFYYNDRVSELAGAFKDETNHWQWHAMVHDEDIERTRQEWANAIKTGTIYQMEHRVKMQDGSYRWFLSRAVPHKLEDGSVSKWFGTATDIHSTKEYEATLEKEVKKRTAELSNLNKSLEQSNEELQQFAHVASHDLKEPLRKIKTFTGRLSQDESNKFSERSQVFLEKVKSASDRMMAMIDGVLHYSVINVNEQNIEPVDLNQVMKSIVEDLELPITEKNATVSYKDLPTIDGSAVLLHQMLYNLINNSLKFTRDNVPPKIDVSATYSNLEGKDCVRIWVEDNGIGFEREYAAIIFNTFARLNSKDQFEGTGLGLALCKRIAERHNGKIEATAVLGQGAIFVATLPMKQTRTSI